MAVPLVSRKGGNRLRSHLSHHRSGGAPPSLPPPSSLPSSLRQRRSLFQWIVYPKKNPVAILAVTLYLVFITGRYWNNHDPSSPYTSPADEVQWQQRRGAICAQRRPMDYGDIFPLSKANGGNIANNHSLLSSPMFVVMLTVNDGYFDFFLNWHEHYVRYVASPRPPLVVIAEDSTVYQKLRNMQQHHQREKEDQHHLNLENATVVLSDNIAKASAQGESYDSEMYKSLVSSRATHLLDFLCHAQKGLKNDSDNSHEVRVVYTDVDTVWVKDPLPYFRRALATGKDDWQAVRGIGRRGRAARKAPSTEYYDLMASIDSSERKFPRQYWFGTWGRYAVRPYYCTGIMVLSDTPRTTAFLAEWERELRANAQLNQPIFNQILHSLDGSGKIRHGALPEKYFPSGELYFDQWVTKGSDKNTFGSNMHLSEETIIVHNNYIVGHDAKKKRFDQHDLWLSKG